VRNSAASGGGPRGGAPPAHPPDWRGLTPETALTVGDATQDERESLRDDARSLLTDLRPSVRSDGALATIAAPPQVDLDAPVISLDLHPEEGSRGRTATSLMVQMLFTAVSDRATGTDERVVVIDEVHSLLDDAAALAFLETAVRPRRHYDRFVQFVTQSGGSSITSCVMRPASCGIPDSSAVRPVDGQFTRATRTNLRDRFQR
jgi:hypothetical protein